MDISYFNLVKIPETLVQASQVTWHRHLKWALPSTAAVAGVAIYAFSRRKEPLDEAHLAAQVYAKPYLLGRAVKRLKLDVSWVQEDAKKSLKGLPPGMGLVRRTWNGAALRYLQPLKLWVQRLAVTFVLAYSFKMDRTPSSPMEASWNISMLQNLIWAPIGFWRQGTGLLEPYLPSLWMAKGVSAAGLVAGVSLIYAISQSAPPAVSNADDFTEENQEHHGWMRYTIIRRLATLVGKSTPLLVGPSGVGKSQVVKDFARWAKEKNLRVYGANTSNLKRMGGWNAAAYTSRLEFILQELKDQKNCILFLDEAHALAQSHLGGTEVMGQEFKTVSEKVPIIAATTTEEYEKYIKKDIALDRRFTVIKLEAPNNTQLRDILEKLLYHVYPHILPEEGVIDAIIDASNKIESETAQPSKAIELLHRAISKVLAQENPQQDEINKQEEELRAAQERWQRNMANDQLKEKFLKLKEGFKDNTAEDQKKIAEFSQLVANRRYWNEMLKELTYPAARGKQLQAYAFVKDLILNVGPKLIKKRRKELKNLPLPILTEEVVKGNGRLA